MLGFLFNEIGNDEKNSLYLFVRNCYPYKL